MSFPTSAHHRCKDLTHGLSAIMLLLVLLMTDIDCNHDYTINRRSDDIIHDFGSPAKDSTSTPGDSPSFINTGINVIQKLIRLIGDTRDNSNTNEAPGDGLSPKSDTFMPKKHLDDDLIDFSDLLTDPKIHMHHVFPPHLIKPLQKVIIRKLIHYIKKDPIKKYKKKMKRVARVSTVAVGLGIGIKEIKELKSRPPIAHYSVSGLEDLSGKKAYKKYKRERRDDNIEDDGLYDVTKDSGDPDYKTVRDYKLFSEKSPHKHHWPFSETKEEIYEKWNRFPAPVPVDPFHQKIKYIHRSFHELSPDLHHLVQDVNGLVGTKTKVISSGPELESPLVLAGQFLKLLDSLIPSIRIRIPFVEYLVKSFWEKSKPKVVYVKQKPHVKYVGVPYQGDSMRGDIDWDDRGEVQGEPIQVNIPITVPVPEPVIVPEPVPQQHQQAAPVPPTLNPDNYQRVDNQYHNKPIIKPHFYTNNQINRHENSINAYPEGYQPNGNTFGLPYMTGQSNYESNVETPTGAYMLHNMNDQTIRIYKDRKAGRA